MIEPKAGIFLGRMTARVRDELWKKITAASRGGACLQIWSAPTEQGFQFRSFGQSSRELVDFEGLYLVSTTAAQTKS
ncbi:MAG: type I-E CRISPR-associated endoribonuclease Cas2e [Thermoguttaceae bacterium]